MGIFFSFFQRSASGISAFNEWVGRAVSWLTLFMVLITFIIVVLRYLFGLSWVAMQESVSYLHSLVFMLGAAFTLKQDGHVRVDILYQRWAPKIQAWIDLLVTVFLLLPMAGFILWSSWEYVLDAWEISEGSRNSGGLPFVYLLKSCLLLMPLLLIMQGVALLLNKLAQIMKQEEQHG